MAAISAIRKHSGLILVVMAITLIAMLLLFAIDDPASLSKSQNNVGKIEGKEISINEFQNTLDLIVNNFTRQNGQSPDESAMHSLREQAWKKMIEDIVYTQQYDNLGLTVSQEEMEDMIFGMNVHPGLTQAKVFQDKNTGRFDPTLVQRYLQNFDNLPEESKQEWLNFEKGIRDDRITQKYMLLMGLSSFVPTAEARQDEMAKTDKADIKYLFVPYTSIPDSAVKPEDSELKEYYNSHKNKFKTEETKSIEYLQFSIVPTPEDTAVLYKEVLNLYSDFKTSKEDSLFIRNHSDLPADTNFYSIGDVIEKFKNPDSIKTGFVSEPVIENDYYVMHKILEMKSDSIFSARASHILIKVNTPDDKKLEKEALAKCNEILQDIKKGKDFTEMARIHGSDGTASKGGDLGWFKQGAMVKEFNDAVFNATKKGLLEKPIKTQFGYHLIKVTELKNNQQYRLGSFYRKIEPSDQTVDEMFKKADNFAASSRTLLDFRNEGEKNHYVIQSVDGIKPDEVSVRGLPNSRALVRWLNNAENQTVSDVIELENSYVIAVVTKQTEKGFSPISEIKTQLEFEVRNQKKGDLIKSRLDKTSGTLDEILKNYNQLNKEGGAEVNTADGILFSNGSIPGKGVDNIAIGKIFGTPEGKRINAFTGSRGVFIIDVIKRHTTVKNDSPVNKTQLMSSLSSKSMNGLFDAIKEISTIEDNRNKFY